MATSINTRKPMTPPDSAGCSLTNSSPPATTCPIPSAMMPRPDGGEEGGAGGGAGGEGGVEGGGGVGGEGGGADGGGGGGGAAGDGGSGGSGGGAGSAMQQPVQLQPRLAWVIPHDWMAAKVAQVAAGLMLVGQGCAHSGAAVGGNGGGINACGGAVGEGEASGNGEGKASGDGDGEASGEGDGDASEDSS